MPVQPVPLELASPASFWGKQLRLAHAQSACKMEVEFLGRAARPRLIVSAPAAEGLARKIPVDAIRAWRAATFTDLEHQTTQIALAWGAAQLVLPLSMLDVVGDSFATSGYCMEFNPGSSRALMAWVGELLAIERAHQLSEVLPGAGLDKRPSVPRL